MIGGISSLAKTGRLTDVGGLRLDRGVFCQDRKAGTLASSSRRMKMSIKAVGKDFTVLAPRETSSRSYDCSKVFRSLLSISLTSKNSSRNQDTLEFICEHWSFSAGNKAPTLGNRQTILVQTKATNWLLYDNSSDEKSTLRVGKAAPAMFSPDCRFLRIGAQLFALDDQGSYISIQGFNTENEMHPPYIEEFTSNLSQPYVVFATRRNITKGACHQGIRDERKDASGAKAEEDKNTVIPASDRGDDQDRSADSESDSSHASSTNSTAGAYETWSECSTEPEDEFEDDIIAPWTGPVGMEEGGFSDSSGSSDEEGKENTSDADESAEPGSDSSSEDSDLPTTAIVGYGRWYSDDEGHDEDGEGQIVLTRRPLTQSRDLQASLTVVDTSYSTPRRIFRFSYTLPSLLYASPPVLHPSKPLVVWPLGGGDVLFADFMANTYFVRKLRPSTSHSEYSHVLSVPTCTLITLSSTACLHEMPLLHLWMVPTYSVSRSAA